MRPAAYRASFVMKRMKPDAGRSFHSTMVSIDTIVLGREYPYPPAFPANFRKSSGSCQGVQGPIGGSWLRQIRRPLMMDIRPDSPEQLGPSPDGSPLVFILDDDVSTRETVERLVSTAGWRPAPFATASDFLEQPKARVPACVVLNVRLPDSCGLDLQRRISEDRGVLPVVFVAGYGDVSTAVRAMKAGAVDFLTKPCPEAALHSAIKAAIERSRETLRREGALTALRERYTTLTPREREVMSLVTAGLLNKQVGAELAISEITVKAHRGKVMRKMKARSIAALVEMASRLATSSCPLGRDREEGR